MPIINADDRPSNRYHHNSNCRYRNSRSRKCRGRSERHSRAVGDGGDDLGRSGYVWSPRTARRRCADRRFPGREAAGRGYVFGRNETPARRNAAAGRISFWRAAAAWREAAGRRYVFRRNETAARRSAAAGRINFWRAAAARRKAAKRISGADPPPPPGNPPMAKAGAAANTPPRTNAAIEKATAFRNDARMGPSLS